MGSWAQNGVLVWNGTLDTLALFERARTDRPPRLRFDVHAEVCNLVTDDPNAMPIAPRYRMEPHRIFIGGVEVEYAPHVWAAMLRELKVLDLVVVEIPLPAALPARWHPVWEEVGNARTALAQGGEAGWRACVVHVRNTLEAWRQIEDEQPWPATPKEREALSKHERLSQLRWSLHQAAHPAVHVGDARPSEVWTREEAKFMLATLCWLLAMREP